MNTKKNSTPPAAKQGEDGMNEKEIKEIKKITSYNTK
jgi:hypothetical protein